MQYHQSALKLHSKRAAYQGEIIWGQVEPFSLDLSQNVQLTGDGVGKATRGSYTGLTFPSSCKLSRTNQMWLQEGLLWEVQMSSLCWG